MNKLIYLLIGITICYSWTIFTPQENLTFKEKEAIANEILQRLFQSVGDHSSKNCPTLKIDNAGSPFYYHKGKEIYLSEAWIDICLNNRHIGKTGLAIILGHELHHFFQKEKSAFYGSLPEAAQEKVKEKEADKFGLFYCYLAGYKDIDSVHPLLLQTVYQTFKLNKTASNYPPLSQRIQSDHALRQQVKEAHHLFKVATFLTLNGAYRKALIFYQQLEHSGLMTKEIYNNYGLAKAMSQLTNVSGSWLYLAYPFEIAYHSPLLIELSRSNMVQKIELTQAIGLFQQALIQDATYESAIFNLFTAYAAGGDLTNFNAYFVKYQTIIQRNPLLKEKIEFAKILCEFNQEEQNRARRAQTIKDLTALEKRSNVANRLLITANINALKSPNSTIQSTPSAKASTSQLECLDYTLPKENMPWRTINIGDKDTFKYCEITPHKTIYQLQLEREFGKNVYVHQMQPQTLDCEPIRNSPVPMISPYYLFGEYFSSRPYYPNVIFGVAPNTNKVHQIWYSF